MLWLLFLYEILLSWKRFSNSLAAQNVTLVAYWIDQDSAAISFPCSTWS